MTRQEQITKAPILANEREKLAALRPDMAQDEELPPFRHWVGSDYDEPREDPLNAAKGFAYNLPVGLALWALGAGLVWLALMVTP